MTKPPGTTIHDLDLDDLDRVVGGGARGASPEVASHHGHDTRTDAFLASVHDVVAAADHAGDLAAHGEHPSHPAEVIGEAHAHALDASHVVDDLHAHAPIGGVSGDPLAHHDVAASLGAEAVHDLAVARHLVAALGAHVETLGYGLQGDHHGAASSPSAWPEAFEPSLGHGSDDWSAGAPAALTVEALQWETRFLHDGATLDDTIAATEPTFAARTRAVLAETRHVLAAVLSSAGQGSDP